MATRILVLDDTDLGQDDVLRLLANAPELELLDKVSDQASAIAQARKFKPEVILMDLRTPYKESLAVLQKVIDENPDTKVICMTLQNDPNYVDACLEAGCVGYLLKDCAHEELVHAVRTVLKNKTFLSRELADDGRISHLRLDEDPST